MNDEQLPAEDAQKKAAQEEPQVEETPTAEAEEISTEEIVAPEEVAGESSMPEDEATPEEKATTEAEAASEEESDDHTDDEKDEHDDHAADYASLSEDELIAEAERVLKETSIDKMRLPMLALRNVLTPRWDEEHQKALEKFVEEGGNIIDFRLEQPKKEAFYAVFKEFKKRRSDYRKALNDEMANNLVIKQKLLDDIKALAESEELPTGATYNKFKQINDHWKEVGHVPADQARDLYATYRFFVDRFYDNLRLSHELRELDYKHNKEVKEQLIAEIQALAAQSWSAAVGQSLQKLHESWKETGPVSNDDKEVLWGQFRTASNILHGKRRDKHIAAKAANKERLSEKVVIVEAMEALAQLDANDHQAWQKGTTNAKKHREAMAKVGRTFGGDSEAIWDRFKKAEKAFFKARNQFYKARKSEFKDAIQTKTNLAEQAEQLAKSEDLGKALGEIKKLQQDWKKTGFAPRKASDAVWNRFKAACDIVYQGVRGERQAERAAYEADRKKRQGVNDARTALDHAQRELTQLENNLGFFQFASSDSPVVKDAMAKVEAARKKVEKAQAKLKAERVKARQAAKAEEAPSAPETPETGESDQPSDAS